MDITFDPLAFSLHILASYLRSHLPPWLWTTLSTIFTNGYALYLYITSFLPPALSPQALIPPLLSLFTLYITLRSMYRTTMWFARSSWFMIKWSPVIALVIAMVWGVGGGNAIQKSAGPNPNENGGNWGDPLNSAFANMNSKPDSDSRRRSKRPSRVDTPPTIFDTFSSHRNYAGRRQRQQQQAGGEPVEGDVMDQVMSQFQELWKENGKTWWEMFGKFAGFDSDPPSPNVNVNQLPGDAQARKKKKSSKKGTGQVR